MIGKIEVGYWHFNRLVRESFIEVTCERRVEGNESKQSCRYLGPDVSRQREHQVQYHFSRGFPGRFGE